MGRSLVANKKKAPKIYGIYICRDGTGLKYTLGSLYSSRKLAKEALLQYIDANLGNGVYIDDMGNLYRIENILVDYDVDIRDVCDYE